GAVAVVGRGPCGTGASLPIDDPAVSRRHARIAIDAGGQVAVVDAGSRNGTGSLRDGDADPVDGPALLAIGDELRIGRSRVAVLGPPASGPRVGPTRRPDPTTGTVAHNRPPRPARPGPPAPVAVPHPPAPPGRRVPLGVAAV